MFVQGHDVTEQHRAMAALRESEERQAFLAEAGWVLGSSLDYEQTLRSVAEIAIPPSGDRGIRRAEVFTPSP